jgi:hypothetical protein
MVYLPVVQLANGMIRYNILTTKNMMEATKQQDLAMSLVHLLCRELTFQVSFREINIQQILLT